VADSMIAVDWNRP